MTASPLLPDPVEIATLWWDYPDQPLEVVDRLNADAVHCNVNELNAERIAELTAAGIPVRSYTVNDPNKAKALFDMGLSSIFTDFPDRFIKRF